MAKEAGRQDDVSLDARGREILKSVIRAHIVTGEPVGSRTLSRSTGLDLSPATIRNIMADLEEQGLLAQPHASAGRIPTDRAYRLFVDRLMGRQRVTASLASAVDEALVRSRGDIPELLAETSRQLSRFSKNVGVVLVPEVRRIVVEHIEFVRLDTRRVVTILVDRAGVVHNRIVETDSAPDQGDLDRFGRQLSGEFAGRTLPDMRRALLARMSEETAQCDRILARSLDLARSAVEGTTGNQEIIVEGASNLLGSPDFPDVARMKALFRTLEEKSRLVELLERMLEGEGVQVVIGRENPVPDLADCSLVTSSYRSDDRVMGTVGIVGPTRMEYARTIALVDHLARVLTRLLSGAEN